jgi:Derlin-2/3
MSLAQRFFEVPVITRTYMVLSFLVTLGCTVEMLSPFQLYFSPKLIWRGEIWRSVTSFFFFGSSFSIQFFFHMFFLQRYCWQLETGSFRNRKADFLYMIIFGAVLICMVAPWINLTFLGTCLTFMMVYVWARRNPYVPLNFLGLFTFNAPYLPWAMLLFTVSLGNDGLTDVVGIAVGHLYYVLEDVYPVMIPSSRRLLKTPSFIEAIFRERPVAVAAVPVAGAVM